MSWDRKPELFEFRPACYYLGRTLIFGDPSKTVQEFKAALEAEQESRERLGLGPVVSSLPLP
jgi:hypothetical protein